jgi:hypothetical protein
MKLKPIKANKLFLGCLSCSSACLKAPMNMQIAVGFGDAFVTKNGKVIYDGEKDLRERGKARTVKYFENLARKEPKADWRIIKYSPLHGEIFQRQGKNNWVCVKSNKGFA